MKCGAAIVSIGLLEARTPYPDGTTGGSRGGELNAAIARAAVRIHRAYVGRGPTKAHAFFRGNIVVVIFENVLVRAEQTLMVQGHVESVLELRRELLETMRPDLTAAVEELTDRRVTALMGDTNLDADIASHVFVLDRPV
jgi:uncharacterized protein YbcI